MKKEFTTGANVGTTVRFRVSQLATVVLLLFLRVSQVHQAVIDAGEGESGCTIHEVTETVDGGPIVIQKKVKVWNLLLVFLSIMRGKTLL